jgi:hypothetical protein
LNAAELGADKIRVNVRNPDAVISDSKIWEGAWRKAVQSYGIQLISFQRIMQSEPC